MKETTIKCHECENTNSFLFYIEKNDKYYCEFCNKIFEKQEVISLFWTEHDLTEVHIDKQMDNIVEESANNLLHEIKMIGIFENKAKKREDKEIINEVDKLLEEIFSMV